ncbi:MAG: 3-methyl-2-oxobutanoate hydroxymethyltransferase [Actinomycetota bacterium]|nr:3-methyl-2-oxobutanoate hydroxymethyltransferase [Actinomycetota bacterium]
MSSERITVPKVRSIKVSRGFEPLTMITAYDFHSARHVDLSGAEMILVGDSLAMVVLGHSDTLSVTVSDMAYHTKAVKAADTRAMVVTDMPWMSYHTSKSDAKKAAAKLIRAGAQGVKVEGGKKRADVVKSLVDAEIPVVGHIGLTPQSVNSFGGFKVQGKDLEAARGIIEDAKAIEAAGAFAIVLEAIPNDLATEITSSLSIPTIGIGAGLNCDGQVLVYHDVLGYGVGRRPKFVKAYADVEQVSVDALSKFVKEVRTSQFPTESHTYHSAESSVGKIY